MKATTDLTGIDADLETSLVEYGLAWKTADDDENDYLFYYGIKFANDEKGYGFYSRFDHAHLAKDTDKYKEWDWVDWFSIYSFTGTTKEEYDKMPIASVVYDLISYYGYENVFGTSYFEGMTYDEIIEKNN
jgi:hypothetical protein